MFWVVGLVLVYWVIRQDAPGGLFGGSAEAGLNSTASDPCAAPLPTADDEVLAGINTFSATNSLYEEMHDAPDDILGSGTYNGESFEEGAEHSLQEASSSSAVSNAYNAASFCPLTSKADRLAAAEEVGGSIRKTAQYFNEFTAWIWSDGEDRYINPATDSDLRNTGPLGSFTSLTGSWADFHEAGLLVALLPTLILTDGGNRTSWFVQSAEASCWEPVPLANGPMLFKYSLVEAALTDTRQERGYYTATTDQHPDFFHPELPLFLFGPRHVAIREFWQTVGFARRYDVDVSLARAIPETSGCQPPAETEVAAHVASLVTPAIWGAAPPQSVVAATDDYAKYGKYAIFGAAIQKVLSPVGIAGKIRDARAAVSQWALTSPFGELLKQARDLQHPVGSPGHAWFATDAQLIDDVATATLFAGLVGTTDMTNKCIIYQKRDARHQALFKSNPEKYLIELMRFDSAVTSVTELLRDNQTMTISGRSIKLMYGTPQQLVLASANRDATHWQNPNTFDPERPDLGDTLSWNGKAADVEAQDLAEAPRGCPGFCLSLKIAAAVCAGVMGSFQELYNQSKVLMDDGAVNCTNFGGASLPAPWSPR